MKPTTRAALTELATYFASLPPRTATLESVGDKWRLTVTSDAAPTDPGDLGGTIITLNRADMLGLGRYIVATLQEEA
jgi:hypothetical protein